MLNPYKNRRVAILLTYSFVFMAGLTFANLYAVFAQPAPAVEQSVGTTYMAVVLSAFSIAGNLINWYLAEKAKRVGLNPNSTDEKVAKVVLDLAQTVAKVETKVANLVDFTYSALPEQAQQIVNKPLIRAAEVTKDINIANEKVGKARELVEAIEDTAAPPPKAK